MLTVNELLSLVKAVRERLNGLKGLRSEVSTKDIWSYGGTDKEKKTEPTYDVKAVDKKIAELEIFLFRADAKIKQSNANTTVSIEVDIDKLLEPLS